MQIFTAFGQTIKVFIEHSFWGKMSPVKALYFRDPNARWALKTDDGPSSKKL